MILAVDTYYVASKARTVGLAFLNWSDREPVAIYTEVLEQPAPYEPGLFYKRELPCILSLLKQIDLNQIEAMIVDGFVFLDDAEKPGLGAHLYKAVYEDFPVIGVAKTNFAPVRQLKREVRRGNSSRPLFVSSIGIDLEEASGLISNMYGNHRIPDLLKQLDRLTRE